MNKQRVLSISDLVKVYEIFYNMRDKARDIFSGYIFSDLCDHSYNLRGFNELYHALIGMIEPEMAHT
jgi:hypothetical protein